MPAAPSTPFTLRRAVPDDAPGIAEAYADPDVLANLLQVPFINVAAMRQRLAEQDAPGRTDLQLVAERDGRIVACAGLHPSGSHVRRRHVMGLGIGVARPAQGQGIGHALMQALLDHADRWGQVLRIELTVFTDNTRAIALYQKFGFRIEGTHRGFALREGVYADVHSMARLHPNPPVLAWPPE